MKWISSWYLKSKLKGRKRKVYFHSLKRAKTALLVYDGTNREEEKKLIQFSRYLKEEGIAVESLVYFGKTGKKIEKPSDEQGRLYFDKNDLNWFGVPKLSAVRKRLGVDYDILVDLNLSENYPLEVISSLSKAKFKVGPTHGYAKEVLDLSISLKQENLDHLLEQIQVYLEMINTK